MKRFAVLVLALLALPVGAWKFSGLPGLQLFGTLVPRVETERRVVALTFDDGPAAPATDRILAILREKSVPATFFLVGDAMARRPGLARRIVDEGHQLGNHSWSHARMVGKSPSFVRRELDATDAQIRAAGYGDEIVFRPPYGKKLLVLPWVLRERGTTTVTWDLAPESDLGPGASAEDIVDRVRQQARPGSIILLHVMFSSREASLAAVPGIIDALRAEGYGFVTVNELRRPGA